MGKSSNQWGDIIEAEAIRYGISYEQAKTALRMVISRPYNISLGNAVDLVKNESNLAYMIYKEETKT